MLGINWNILSVFKVLPASTESVKDNTYLCKSKLFVTIDCGIVISQCVSTGIGLMMLCAASHVISPPTQLPDLFPVLISGYSCILFLLSALYFNVTQFSCYKTVHFNNHHTDKHLKSD